MLHAFPVPRAYSYTRFSTPEQAAGDSYRRQTEAARSYADAQGLTLDDSLDITDLGVSAFKGANLDPEAGLGRFIDAVRQGLVEPGSVLIVESIDRLSRGVPRRTVRLLEDIVDAGVDVVTLNDGQRYDRERLDTDPLSLMVAWMVAIRAHEESAIKGRRVAAAWAEKRRKVRAGKEVRLTKRGPAWLVPDGDGWAVDADRAAVVRRVYAMTLAGVGEHKIAETLNRERVLPFGRAKQWHRSAVAKLLRNPAVIGTLTPGRIEHSQDGRKRRVHEDPIERAFPAIIEEPDWNAVRALKEAVAVRGRAAKHPLSNMLAGLARCPICGSAMTRVNKGARSLPKLVCTTAKAGAGCTYHSVSLADVEAAIVSKPGWIVDGIPAGTRGEELDREADTLAGSIAGLEEHFRELSEATERVGKSRPAAERLAQLGAEIDTAKAQLEAVEERRRLTDGGLVRVRAVALAHAVEAFDGDHREAINAAMRVLFDGVTVDYLRGLLAFDWKQGGTTTLPYGSPFGPE